MAWKTYLILPDIRFDNSQSWIWLRAILDPWTCAWVSTRGILFKLITYWDDQSLPVKYVTLLYHHVLEAGHGKRSYITELLCKKKRKHTTGKLPSFQKARCTGSLKSCEVSKRGFGRSNKQGKFECIDVIIRPNRRLSEEKIAWFVRLYLSTMSQIVTTANRLLRAIGHRVRMGIQIRIKIVFPHGFGVDCFENS